MGLFSKKEKTKPDDDENEDEDESNREMVLFGGATNGNEANLQENAKLVQMALIPAKEMLTDALEQRAGMIRIEPKGGGSLIYFIVDGVPKPGGKMPAKQAVAVVQMIKLLAGLDIQNRTGPQSGGIKAKHLKTDYILKVNSTPVGNAERLIIQARDKKVDIESPAHQGIPEKFKTKIRELASHNRGLLLTCGPPGTNVTTLMHGVLRSVDSFMSSIFSIAETDIELINVVEFELTDEEPVETSITRIVRNEADILLVDPIPNAEAFKWCLEASKEITFISEFPAKDSVHGLVTLCKWAGGVEPVTESVHGIAHGKLIRLLCDKCKAAFRPNPKFLMKLGLPPETDTLYRHFTPPPPDEETGEQEEWVICKKCGGTGYFGQQPLLELLEMTDEMKELLKSNPDAKQIRALMKKQKMFTLQQDGLRLVSEGKTSLEELKRVFGS